MSCDSFVSRLDLQQLALDTVEQLQRFLPNDQEKKSFKQYEKDKQPVEKLTEEDRLMINVRFLSLVFSKGFQLK